MHHCGFWDRGTFTDLVPFLGGGALYHFIFFFDPLFILRVISQSATTSFGAVNVFQGAPSFLPEDHPMSQPLQSCFLRLQKATTAGWCSHVRPWP